MKIKIVTYIIIIALFLIIAHQTAHAALTVTLSANPSSGNAPLTSQLTAWVTPSGGLYKYEFDCTKDGTIDHTFTTPLATYSYNCTYSNPGSYTAKVDVTNLTTNETGSDTVSITVNPSAVCSDSDGGVNTSQKGTCTDSSGSHTDSCSSSFILNEWSCSGNTCQMQAMGCPAGQTCQNGACVTASCSDSDGGVNTSQKGTCTDSSGSHTDSCSSSFILNEWSCSGNTCQMQAMGCPAGQTCQNGACVAPSCNDPDGNDITQQTTCTDASGSHTDRCTPGPMGAVQVDEYVCSGGNCVIQSQMCPAGQFCQNGACVAAGPVCGNGVCEPGETPANCPADCGGPGPCNNNGTCEPALGENSNNCAADCFCGDGVCDSTETPASCPADCGGGGPGPGTSTFTFTLPNPINATSIQGMIDSLINLAFVIGIALAPVLIIVGGLYFILSGGDPSKIETAKKIIFYTLIGLFVVILARAIIGIIRTILGG